MSGAGTDMAEEREFALDSADSGTEMLRRHVLRIGHGGCRFSVTSEQIWLKTVSRIGGLIIKRVRNVVLLWKLEGIFLRISLTQRQPVC